jgi:GH24 family phage-related lysozyme (muramidase)
MPKIPTFEARGSIEQLAGTTSNIRLSLNNTLASALEPVTKAVVNHKIKENDLQNRTEALRLENDFINEMQGVYEEANVLSNKEQAQNIVKTKSNAFIEKYSALATNNSVKTLFSNYALSEVQKGSFRTNSAISRNILVELDNNVNLKKERLLTTAFLADGAFDYGVLTTDLQKLYTDNYSTRISNAELTKLVEGIPGEIKAYEATNDITNNPRGALVNLLDESKYEGLTLKNRQSLIRDAKNILLPQIDNDWKNYVAAAAQGKEPIPFNMDFAKKVLPAETITQMEEQLTIIDDTISKVAVLNSVPSKDLNATMEQYALEIDTKVSAGALDFILGEKKKEYYNDIIKNRQELLSSDPVTFVTENNDDIKSALETIESTEDETQKNILQTELATALITAQTELGVPKYEQKIMTTSQSQSWVYQYKNGDENTRVAMLQGLEMQFGDLNNKAYQQLLADGLPETAILSSYFQNAEMTKSFLGLDSENKRKTLKQWGTDNGVDIAKVRKNIRTNKSIKLFEDIVAENGGANSAATVDQMENIVEILSYYTINDMFVNGSSQNVAEKKAIGIIKDNFQRENTYYIPKIWNGKKFSQGHVDGVVDKAQLIQDHYLKEFNAVAFGSEKDETLTIDIESDFNLNIKDNGEWRNTADGESLIYGIILSDGEFAPIKNANGDFLQFSFDDDSYILPGTDIKMNITLNDIIPTIDNSAALPTDTLQFDENSKPRFAGLVETNKFIDVVKEFEGEPFLTATQAFADEQNLTIGYGRNNPDIKAGDTISIEQAEENLKADIEVRLTEVQDLIPNFSNFSDELQKALFYEYYRGSVRQSPKTIELINAGEYGKAAKEFLNNDEYKNASKRKRIRIRKTMKKVSDLLRKEGTI